MERNIVEKVIALERVELLSGLSPDQLAQIASIADEVVFGPEQIILSPSVALDALYIILEGAVEISRNDRRLHIARESDVLGSWALFDDSPSPVTAKTLEETAMLRIARDDFYELLSDHMELAASIFSTLVRRFRNLIEQS